jgi:2-polyprenyl-3-methyl-5-hydroxy-6-metoxy-1,4-benzoquinol methylase
VPEPDRELLSGGHYARKQIFSRSRLVAWSHGRRFELARRLVAARAGQRLLDYGCGDGTFLTLVHDLFPEAAGVDIEPGQVEGCRERLSPLTGLSFGTIDSLSRSRDRSFDVIVCMEVLEHCPDDVQRNVLADLHRLATPDATIVISVPIEIGPTLAAKQAARAFAAWRGLSEYKSRERYGAAELVRMVLGGRGAAIPREENVAEIAPGKTVRFTGHKGFNWRRLEIVIADRFTIERRLFSPMPWLGAWLNSQVWFVCRRT